MNAFDAHPLLVLVLGLLGLPLLLDPPPRGAANLRAGMRRRDPIGLLAAGLVLGVLARLLVPGLGLAVPEGLAAWPWLSLWLGGLSLPLVLLEPYMTRHRSWSAFSLWPACLFWPWVDLSGGRVDAGWWAPLIGLLGALLLLLLRGVLERFRQNRSPRGLDGLPVRLLTLGLLFMLWQGAQAWWAGNLP